MTEEERLRKNSQIAQTKKETIARHSNMTCKTFTVKIQKNKLSQRQKEELKMLFVEAKWFKNHILNWCEEDSNRKLSKFDRKTKDILRRDKDNNVIEQHLNYLTSSLKNDVLDTMLSNIKTLSTLKKKGYQKPGRLKYVREINALGLCQYGVTHKVVSPRRLKLQGVHKTVPVNGLEQFLFIPEIEICNARLLKKADDYYVQFVTYTPKELPKETNGEIIGIDFGCATNFTLSTGEKVNASIQEGERLKTLQRKLARQKKGSKNWNKTKTLIQKEYNKITNKKTDTSNKLIAHLMEYEIVVFQDELLKAWHKGGHGKAVQHSILGRVKSRLLQLSTLYPDRFIVLSSSCPTTKLCTKCGKYHDDIKLSNRWFECDCGVSQDRDIHAAENMIWFYLNNVGVGRSKITPVEMRALIRDIFDVSNQLSSEKQEANDALAS